MADPGYLSNAELANAIQDLVAKVNRFTMEQVDVYTSTDSTAPVTLDSGTALDVSTWHAQSNAFSDTVTDTAYTLPRSDNGRVKRVTAAQRCTITIPATPYSDIVLNGDFATQGSNANVSENWTTERTGFAGLFARVAAEGGIAQRIYGTTAGAAGFSRITQQRPISGDKTITTLVRARGIPQSAGVANFQLAHRYYDSAGNVLQTYISMLVLTDDYQVFNYASTPPAGATQFRVYLNLVVTAAPSGVAVELDIKNIQILEGDESETILPGFQCMLFAEGAEGFVIEGDGVQFLGGTPNLTFPQNTAASLICCAPATWIVLGGSSP